MHVINQHRGRGRGALYTGQQAGSEQNGKELEQDGLGPQKE